MTNNSVHHLQQEYEFQKALFEKQPAIVQRFLESQAQVIADTLVTKTSQVRFTLPNHVVTQIGNDETIPVPEEEREIHVGGFLQRDVRDLLTRRLSELEKSDNQSIAVSAGLLRYATATHMVEDILPSGRTVTYRPDDDEQYP